VVEVVDLDEIVVDLVASEIVVGVVALEIVVGEMTVEMTEEVDPEEVEEVENASTATRLDIWQEIVLMETAEVEVIAEEGVVALEVTEEVTEEAEVVAAELAITATRKATWRENAPKETAEIVEDDRSKFSCYIYRKLS